MPVVYDTKTDSIVNNESSEIIRFLNTAFNEQLPEGSEERALDLYPEALRQEIDDINSWIYSQASRCGS